MSVLNAQYEGRRFDGDPYCVIPEELAVQKLFLHQAEIDSIEVSDQEVLQQVETRISWLTEQIGSKKNSKNITIKLLPRYVKCCVRIFVTD